MLWQSLYFQPISDVANFCWEISKFTWRIHQQTYICKYIKSAKLELCSDLFSGQLCQPGVLNEDPTVWLDATKPADVCIPPSFLGCAHGVPTPKFYHPIWHHLWGLHVFLVAKFIGSDKCCQWLFGGGKSLKK
jgi:hypothetical protein